MNLVPASLEVRPIVASDADALGRFHSLLSLESTRLRYFSPHPRLSQQEVEHLTHVDHRDREALVALIGDAIVGVARYERLGDTTEAEVAFVVADEWHRHGLGSMLLDRLATRARSEGIERLVADTLCENHQMVNVFEQSGFPLTRTLDHGVVHVEMAI